MSNKTLHCRRCGNTYYLWKPNSFYFDNAIYCDGCKREMEEAERKARNEAAKSKSNYCPLGYNFIAPNWSRVEKDISGYVWNHCKIYCHQNHCVYYQDKFDPSKSAGYYHQEITNILSKPQCPKCKREVERKKSTDDAVKKSNDYNVKSNEIMNKLNKIQFDEQGGCNTDNIDFKESNTPYIETLNDLNQMDQELNNLKTEAETQFAAVSDLITACKDMTDEIDQQQLIESKQKLETIVNGIKNIQSQLLNAKQKARERIKVTNEKLIDLKKKEKSNTDAFIAQKQKENELNDIDEEIQSSQKEMRLNGAERNANPEAATKIDKKYNDLLKNLKEKHNSNKERSGQLEKCQDSINNIKAKLIATQSKNKYVIECLDKEYDRLDDISQGAQVKYQQFPMYFLTMELQLKEEVMDTFKEVGLHEDMDSILELIDDDLKELGIKTNFKRKNILKKIKEFKEKQLK
eukprot:165074_1